MRNKSWNANNLKDDSGAAMIIVLTIIFVITALGGVALLATMTNLRMSVKYAGWTSDYYALDNEAEKKLGALDGRLFEAESYAYEYMRSECYRLGEGTPVITGAGATDINEKAQAFIYNTWYTGVYVPSLTKAGAETAVETNPESNAEPGRDDGVVGAVVLDENRYNNLFARFNGEFFQRLYYFFSYRLISRDVRDGIFESVELTPMLAGYAGMLDGYENDPDGMKVVIGVTDGKDEYAKRVTVNALVTAPVYGYETRAEDLPFRANPVWTGALTARGSIRFNGDKSAGGNPGGVIHVYGDVNSVDYNEFYIDQNDWAPMEGNNNGVASTGAAVEIYGNVYSRGDFHVTGDGGSVTVRRYLDDYSADYKKSLFGNTLFFDASSVPVPIQRYTQPDGGAWEREFIPFFYRDRLGGNVYCNNLGIGKDVRGASIIIENGPAVGGGNDGMTGVVWTLDDVQNDGLESGIYIKGNLIGISSDATFDDHTESSAVINTNYESGVIELSGAVVAPGVSFMRFDRVNDKKDDYAFFKTAESVSASNTAILNAYMKKPPYDPGVLYFYDRYALETERGISDFFLVNYEAPIDMARHLISILSERIPDTGIITGESLEGYTRGAVISADKNGVKRMFGPPGFGEIEGYGEIKNYAGNYLAYSEIKDSLKTAYKLKTESLGVSGYKFGDFIKLSALLDPTGKLYPGLENAITFFIGDSTLELEGELTGIVYCASAMDGSLPVLTIRGDGSFHGTIICEGDINIDGAPDIYYDEKIISKILLYNQEIRDFFSPGEMGETAYVRIMGVAQGVKKLIKERYKIVDWLQWQD